VGDEALVAMSAMSVEERRRDGAVRSAALYVEVAAPARRSRSGQRIA
jgi:hypothetical protein